jgi:outer membrane lipoprotein carrier protein
MIYRIFILLLLFFSNYIYAAQRGQVWSYLENMHSYQAAFQQLTFDAKGNVLQQSRGQMALLRPGNLRWEIVQPMHQIIWVNKKTVWIYDVDLEQASKNKITSNTPGMLLSHSGAQMKQQFTVKETQTKKGGLLCFILHSNHQTHPQTAAADVTLCFKQGILHTMFVKQDFSGVTQFAFSNIKINHSIDPSVFKFSAPKNTQILNESS